MLKNRKEVRKKKSTKNGGVFRIFFRYCLYFAFSGFISIVMILLYFSQDLPDLKHLQTSVRAPEVAIQTYDGKVIQYIVRIPMNKILMTTTIKISEKSVNK